MKKSLKEALKEQSLWHGISTTVNNIALTSAMWVCVGIAWQRERPADWALWALTFGALAATVFALFAIHIAERARAIWDD